MTAQIKATWRHDRNEPRKNTIKMPDAEDMPLHAINIPRIEGSLNEMTKTSSINVHLESNLVEILTIFPINRS